jgi:TIGR03987 family protein
MFGAGLVFDTIGTTLMSRIAKVHFQLNFHGITGLLAIILMLIHAVWATMVLYSDKDEAKRKFHKFSIAVWLIWLIPFMSGAIFGMMK